MKKDVFAVEIIQDSLLAIGDEMFVALARSSMSPVIYEVLDYACGLTDAQGNLISQGNGVTSFIGMLSPMVQRVIEKFDNGQRLHEGDVIIINDPYVGGGSHLSDVGLVLPIFYQGEIIAYSANKAHWTEVGGMDPGSFTSNSNEIYQEGLQLPGVKLYHKGELNEAIYEIISTNVRLPELSIGDMFAQVAALKTGEKRITELCQKFGAESVKLSIQKLLDKGEKIVELELQHLPKGKFYAEDFIEGDPLKGGPYPIKVKVTISDEEFICDFRGSHPAVNVPVNCSKFGLMASVRVMFLALLGDIDVINEGVFKRLTILTDENSIVSAKRPHPVSMNFEARIGAADLIWKALAPHLPERLSAGHLQSVCTFILTGKNPENDESFLIVEPSVGGWGASNDEDGQSGQYCMGDGETYNLPVEIAETKYGIQIDEYSLNCDGAGTGQFRGGLGVRRVYTINNDGQKVSVNLGRHQFAPFGLSGGGEGSHNYLIVHKKDGSTIGPVGVLANYELQKGDRIELVTATGGGYGNPLERSTEAIERDVLNEYISVEVAKKHYGYQNA
ncbi:hydantoinase B/oxoprolinase family protein [Lysinibacillus sp. RSDA_15]|uniref:hydantoinase B/oxoprolinase family protein n=1 Tax=Lysinibacillus sp. RSDA_15 TaxID=3391421 RepID=UPI003A4DC613